MHNELRKIGIFGGTFNPIHIAHLRLAEDVRERCGLGKVLFVPTNIPPHKKLEYEIEPFHRLKMVELAIDKNPHFFCDGVEIKRGGVSYTIDTIDYIYQQYRFRDKPYLIIGSDLLPEIDSWRSIDILKEKVYFVVLLREIHRGRSSFTKKAVSEGIDMSESYIPIEYGNYRSKGGVDFHISFTENRKIDITSSEIRKRIREGRSIRYLVPEKVYEYIKSKRLYE